MTAIQGRTIVAGAPGRPVRGPLTITDTPVNFTAAFTKLQNVLPRRRAVMLDRHHPLFHENLRGKVLVFPTCIGSTHTGQVLLDLVRRRDGPAALLCEKADSLLVAGVLLSEVWYGPSIPVLELDTRALAALVRDGQLVEVDGARGVVAIL